MREGEDVTGPLGAIFGPKAMLINEYAGSGGDTQPWYFRKAGVGPLVGKRTWGGLVGGLGGFPLLMDGGVVTVPAVGFWDPDKGEWVAENTGIAPDVEVEFDPKLWRQGRDPQLEKAVELVMAELAKRLRQSISGRRFRTTTSLRRPECRGQFSCNRAPARYRQNRVTIARVILLCPAAVGLLALTCSRLPTGPGTTKQFFASSRILRGPSRSASI